MRKTLHLLPLAALLLLASTADAQKAGVMLRVSTFGVGGDIAYEIVENVNARLTFNAFSYGQDDLLTEADHDQAGLVLEYDADLGLGSAGLLFDWHPMGNTFHFTAGALYNFTDVIADLRAVEPYTDPDLGETFAPERVGTLNAKVTYEQPIAPYLGAGIGNITKGRLGFRAQVGMAYVGPPSVEMTGTRLIGPTADNAEDIENGVDSFQVYPVLSLGLSLGIGPR
jgi:hypothetical protein